MCIHYAWDIALGFNSAPISAPWISSRTSSPGRGGVWILTGTRDVGWLSTWSVEHTSHYFYLYHHFAWNALHITSSLSFLSWWTPPFWWKMPLKSSEILQFHDGRSYHHHLLRQNIRASSIMCYGPEEVGTPQWRWIDGYWWFIAPNNIDWWILWKRENWRLFILALPWMSTLDLKSRTAL